MGVAFEEVVDAELGRLRVRLLGGKRRKKRKRRKGRVGLLLRWHFNLKLSLPVLLSYTQPPSRLGHITPITHLPTLHCIIE